MTDKHLKYFFKQPQKQMQLIKTQQVMMILLVRIIMWIMKMINRIFDPANIMLVMTVLVRIMMWRMKMMLMTVVSKRHV